MRNRAVINYLYGVFLKQARASAPPCRVVRSFMRSFVGTNVKRTELHRAMHFSASLSLSLSLSAMYRCFQDNRSVVYSFTVAKKRGITARMEQQNGKQNGENMAENSSPLDHGTIISSGPKCLFFSVPSRASRIVSCCDFRTTRMEERARSGSGSSAKG